MSLITEQIKRLKELSMADMSFYKDEDYRKACKEAAETIKVQSAKIHAYAMERSTAYYNGGWIPVKERLPKLNVEVLATTEWGDITIAERLNADAYFIHEGAANAHGEDIIAWRPLPEPYREDGETDE